CLLDVRESVGHAIAPVALNPAVDARETGRERLQESRRCTGSAAQIVKRVNEVDEVPIGEIGSERCISTQVSRARLVDAIHDTPYRTVAVACRSMQIKPREHLVEQRRILACTGIDQ